jgi:hypothetical protein
MMEGGMSNVVGLVLGLVLGLVVGLQSQRSTCIFFQLGSKWYECVLGEGYSMLSNDESMIH